MALRDKDGVGCPYTVERVDPDNPQYPHVALAPMADEMVYSVLNAGGIDCEEGGLVDAVLFIRPTTGGAIAVARVQDLVRGPTFTLDPAADPGPTRGPSATADRTTVRPGQRVTITIGGFAAGSDVYISLWAAGGGFILPLRTIKVDHGGGATVIVTIPTRMTVGRYTIWVEGSDPDSRETGVPIDITVARR